MTRAGSNQSAARRTSCNAPLKLKNNRQGKTEVVVGKQRQSPRSSWIMERQLMLGQIIAKKHLDNDGTLTMIDSYPHGLLVLVIPSGVFRQRIVVPVDEQ